MDRKRNCWEFMNCGRQPGGENADEYGECPAAADSSFEGINDGNRAGRICWAVAGTFCGGDIQGTYAEKRASCTGCEFYKLVQSEEGASLAGQKFLSFISEDSENPFLNKMTSKTAAAGERIISQGEVREDVLILQRGSCLVIVEKNGQMHPVGHRGRGDVLGVVSFLTGESQTAHIEAETDVELWVLDRVLFDNINQDHPELMEFLTEIIADQFDSNRPVADRVIGKYLATDIIGRGGFSIVYKGIHTGLNMPVAIKMLRHHMAMNTDFLATFRKESHTIASLDHENIIKIHDIEERYRTLFIVEELVAGESLKDLLGRLGRIPPPLAINYLLQICSGLAYAHQAGIIHRDINPTNIFVKPNDRIKILDFGLACPIGTEDFASLGTVAYMAPEQIQSEPLDVRTDIYALGLTAFEMITGKRPFPAEDAKELARMHIDCKVPEPAASGLNIPSMLNQFVQRCCRRNPQNRYQQALEALADLRKLAEEAGVATSQLSAPNALHMASIFAAYSEKQKIAFEQFMEEIQARAKELGIILKSAELNDL